MKKLFRNLAIFTILITLGTVLVSSPSILAQTKEDICEGVTLTTGSGCDPAGAKEAETTLEKTIKTIINVFSLIIGIIAVIMIIVGGLKYVTSQGEAANITSAKNTIIYAVVGLVIVGVAQFIVRFVLTNL